MHVNELGKDIAKDEYRRMIEATRTPFKRLVENGFSYYTTDILSDHGIREVRLENHTKIPYPDCYQMKMVINFNVFYGGSRYESYDSSAFVYDRFQLRLEELLELAIPEYNRGGEWKYIRIEYSFDFYFNFHDLIMSILRKSDYVDGRRKLEFKIYSSGVEFSAFEKDERMTVSIHVYRKITERLSKGYHLSEDDEKLISNLYRVEVQLYASRIRDISRQMGIPNGSISELTNSVVEKNIMRELLVSIYGNCVYRKRREVIEIINKSGESVYHKKQLIHILDQINKSSFVTARSKYPKSKAKIFDACIHKLYELGVNPICLNYDAPMDTLQPITSLL